MANTENLGSNFYYMHKIRCQLTQLCLSQEWQKVVMCMSTFLSTIFIYMQDI